MGKEQILKTIGILVIAGLIYLAKKVLEKWCSARNNNNILIVEPKDIIIPKLLYENIEKIANEKGYEIEKKDLSDEECYIEKMCVKGKKKTCHIQYWKYDEDIYRHEKTKFNDFTIIFAAFDGNRLLNDEIYFNEVRDYFYPILKDELLRNGILTKLLCCYEDEEKNGKLKYKVKDKFKDSSTDEVIMKQIKDIIFINKQKLDEGVHKNIIGKYLD